MVFTAKAEILMFSAFAPKGIEYFAEHSQHKSLLAESKKPFNFNEVFGVFVFLLPVSASNREY